MDIAGGENFQNCQFPNSRSYAGMQPFEGSTARDGLPETPEQLLALRAPIGEDRKSCTIQGQRAAGISAKREHFAFMTDTDSAMIAGVRAGLGVGGVQGAMARQWGDLMADLPGHKLELDMWLVTHPDLRLAPQVQIVLDKLRDWPSSFGAS